MVYCLRLNNVAFILSITPSLEKHSSIFRFYSKEPIFLCLMLNGAESSNGVEKHTFVVPSQLLIDKIELEKPGRLDFKSL